MAQVMILAPVTAAVTAKTPSYGVVTANYPYVVFSADALATTETATIYMLVGNTWLIAKDQFGNAAILTATIPMLELDGGPNYSMVKDVTASACGLYVDFGSARR